ncbi:hypothetical protein V1498_11955 [Peribacillus sp. SCS-26]
MRENNHISLTEFTKEDGFELNNYISVLFENAAPKEHMEEKS